MQRVGTEDAERLASLSAPLAQPPVARSSSPLRPSQIVNESSAATPEGNRIEITLGACVDGWHKASGVGFSQDFICSHGKFYRANYIFGSANFSEISVKFGFPPEHTLGLRSRPEFTGGRFFRKLFFALQRKIQCVTKLDLGNSTQEGCA